MAVLIIFPTVAKMVAEFAISPAYAQVITGVIGTAVATLAGGSIPSLNEGYHKSAYDPLTNLANKVANRNLPHS